MPKVIVTGATSYLAIALIKRLLAEKYYVYAVIRPKSANSSKLPKNTHLFILELDMNNYFSLSAMELGKIDAIYHFAWDGVRGSDRTITSLQMSNIEATKQLLDVAHQKHISYFIGMGSQAEYGLTAKQLVTEEMPLNPLDAYGIAKKQIYDLGMKAAEQYGFTFVWARIFSAYGYGESPNTLIMSSFRKMLKDEEIKLSPCEHLWDYLYLDDLANALHLLYKAQCPTGAYNVSYGCPRPLKDYVEEMKEVLHSNSRLEFGAIPYGQNVVQMNPSITKIRSAASWTPKINFVTGIQLLYEDMKNEKNQYTSTNI